MRFAQSLWETSLRSLIAVNSAGNRRSQYEQVLMLAVHMLTLAYTACQACGEQFYITSVQSVKPALGCSGSVVKKRGFNEAIGAGRMEIDQSAR